jgi:hypothetical protein
MPGEDLLVISGDPQEVRGLLAMLRRDPEVLRAGVGLEARESARGELGALSDTIVAVLTNKEFLGSVTSIVSVWLSVRNRPTRIRLKRGDNEVEVENVRGKRAEEYDRELLAQLSQTDEE